MDITVSQSGYSTMYYKMQQMTFFNNPWNDITSQIHIRKFEEQMT